ncbi:Mical-like protein [Globisporangium polare]
MAEATSPPSLNAEERFAKLLAVDEPDLAPEPAADTASSEEDDDSSSNSAPEEQAKMETKQPQEDIAACEDNQLSHDSSADLSIETSKQAIAQQDAVVAVESPSNHEQSNQHEEDIEDEQEEAEAEDAEALDRRMTYIGEGLLDVGGMDAIDRLSDLSSYSDLENITTSTADDDEKKVADVTRHMSIDEHSELPSTTADDLSADTTATASVDSSQTTSASVSAPSPATSKLQAFLAKGNEQKPVSTTKPAPVAPQPQPLPTMFRALPTPPHTQTKPVTPAAAVPAKKSQLPTVAIENRRSKLLDFLANDIGERYLDGVYQEETREEVYESTDDEVEGAAVSTKSALEQEQGRQRRTKRANSKLLAFLAEERGEKLHKVERGSEDAQRNSTSSETSSTSLSDDHHHAQPKQTSKLLDFVAKVVPEKPKFVIFDPADAVSPTEELEHLVAEEAQKKKKKREDRERARAKVLACLAEENSHEAPTTIAQSKPASSTVKSVDETKVQREKVVDRYGREGLLDFLDRTEAAQQQRIRWATSSSRNSSSSRSGASSPSSSTSSSPKSTVVPPTTPPASASYIQRVAVVTTQSPPPPVAQAPAPSRPVLHAGNRLTSFLSKITSKASHSPPPKKDESKEPRRAPQVPPRHESPPPQAQAQAQAAKPVAAPATPEKSSSPSTSSSPVASSPQAVASSVAESAVVVAEDAVVKKHERTAKMQPVLSALSQISQTCATNELNDVAIARITTLLGSISQIVKDDLQKGVLRPVRRWSNASSASPSWVKSGKEIEEFDRKHAVAMAVSSSSNAATATASVPQTPETPALLERNSELKVTVAPTVLQSFNAFEGAQNLLEIVATFHQLLADCGLTDLKLAQPWGVYDHVKAAVGSKLGFRQKQLFKLLDAKFSGDVYNKKPAARKRVCVIGAGPVGLRAAVEMALLGAQVVVLEKRKHFSRENILHLWPWVVQDLTSLGAKVLFPQFCHSTAYFHVGTRQLQCILLKVALLLGVTFFPSTSFDGIAHPDSIDSGRRPFYTIVTKPQIPWMEFTAVLGACGTQDRLSDQARIKRFVFSRKEAIGLVCYFPNHGTTEEKSVAEFSWTIQFKQQLFAKMREIGVDLENIVYYRGEMHYLVMTPKRQNLLDQGVLKLDYPNVADLVLDDNINKPVLHAYLKRVVDFCQIPQKEEFSRVRIFDFSSRTRADKAASILSSKGKKLYVGLIGDSLMEPFWPEGLGTCRGFLSALDGCWMVAQAGFRSDEQLLADRELAYRVIQHVSGFRRDDLQKNVRKYSVDPKTRYVVKFPQLC